MAKGVVITGTHSGCGKTTVTLGILAALKKKGLSVQSFKAGPDFIDPGLHRLVTGRPARNLDIWMCGEDYVKDCFRKRSAAADISVVEGVMGMYDGGYSTAGLARLLDLPVILVVDAYGIAESAGAVVKGFAEYNAEDKKIGGSEEKKSFSASAPVASVIFDRVASENHFERLRSGIRDVPVLGYLPRDLDFEIPHRHLGLTTAEERPLTDENVGKLADATTEHIDIDMLIQSCGRMEAVSAGLPSLRASALRLAVARDKAFCFYYEDNLDLLRNAGAEIVPFSPLSGAGLPDDVDAVYIGGGYPEIYADALSRNRAMVESIRDWTCSGKPLYAECGGLMYLSRGIRDFEGRYLEMAGVFPFVTELKKERPHLGYREIALNADCILGKQGSALRGHEFHYSQIAGAGAEIEKVYSVTVNRGGMRKEGYRFKNTLASYIHLHFGSNLDSAANFIRFIKGK
jgi:cobyrinic acid a,c-diamide synthase